MLKIVFRLFLSLLLILAILYTGAFIFHEKIIFQATKLDDSYEFQFDEAFVEYYILTTDGDSLNALHFTSTENPKGLILYFHGNADNLQRWGEYAIDFTSLGYDLLAIDYRGYGKSSGKPSEKTMYADAESVWEWSKENFNYNKYVIYGRSLGSAVASHLAGQTNPDLLILETPFNNITQNIPPILIPKSYEKLFSNAANLKDVRSKVIILHGDKDRLTKLSGAKKLLPILKPDDEFVIIEGGKHKNLRDFQKFHNTLARVL